MRSERCKWGDRGLALSHAGRRGLKYVERRDFPGDPVAKTLHCPCRGPRVRFVVRN